MLLAGRRPSSDVGDAAVDDVDCALVGLRVGAMVSVDSVGTALELLVATWPGRRGAAGRGRGAGEVSVDLDAALEERGGSRGLLTSSTALALVHG